MVVMEAVPFTYFSSEFFKVANSGGFVFEDKRLCFWRLGTEQNVLQPGRAFGLVHFNYFNRIEQRSVCKAGQNSDDINDQN